MAALAGLYFCFTTTPFLPLFFYCMLFAGGLLLRTCVLVLRLFFIVTWTVSELTKTFCGWCMTYLWLSTPVIFFGCKLWFICKFSVDVAKLRLFKCYGHWFSFSNFYLPLLFCFFDSVVSSSVRGDCVVFIKSDSISGSVTCFTAFYNALLLFRESSLPAYKRVSSSRLASSLSRICSLELKATYPVLVLKLLPSPSSWAAASLKIDSDLEPQLSSCLPLELCIFISFSGLIGTKLSMLHCERRI